MYVFGGKDIENNKLGDLWMYDFKQESWTNLKFPIEEGPISRSGHTSGFFKNFLIIFGGIHELTQEMSDMYLYDAERNHWIMIFEEEQSPLHARQPLQNTSFSNSGKQD